MVTGKVTRTQPPPLPLLCDSSSDAELSVPPGLGWNQVLEFRTTSGLGWELVQQRGGTWPAANPGFYVEYSQCGRGAHSQDRECGVGFGSVVPHLRDGSMNVT